ncbi:sugar transferase [Seohaeicola saemankumensis]|uniref:sugar transferase n=1 Tax=Seohaeicola saemankumensis TaxID=481181 RepID=UPI001E5EE043|nr:sugar transferase [Seohaeicola saemankumensis]MCD1626573.1 sugar transferase [Seohaeicola saemankumensis]
MTPAKRALDIVVALGLLLILAPVIVVVALTILICNGRPVLYLSERMKTPEQAFLLWKFRTMRPVEMDTGVSGGDKNDRITKLGHILRRARLDELPQLFNVLRGDISMVGPRPPLRRYVERFPDLYAQILQQRPGLTGLATIVFHKSETRLLSRCATAAQTEDVYIRRCIPRKARLDLIYAENRTLWLDLRLIAATVLKVLSR